MDANDETRDVAGAEETTKLDATEPASADGAMPAPARRERRSFDRRSALLAVGGVVALLAVLGIGIGIGRKHDGDDGGRFERAGDRGGMPFAGGRGMRGGGPGAHMGGGPGGGPGGDREFGNGGEGRFGGGPGGPGGRGGGMRGGGMGVVTKASSSSITIEPLAGPDQTVTVKLGDGVDVYRRGPDGPGDIEQAKVSDIDAGDIVAVRPDRADSEDADDAGDAEEAEDENRTIDAGDIIILRDGE